jgi:hypothetical protein
MLSPGEIVLTKAQQSALAGAAWELPPSWHIPREWPCERCFILCSGESIGPQKDLIRKLEGRFIAVKHGVYLRPDADVLFLAGEGTLTFEADLIRQFTGTYTIVRSKHHPGLPASVLRVSRTKDHTKLCELTDHVCGYDVGTSAINLAYHFGATEIVMLGYDMTGGHFCKHPLPFPPSDHFRRHMSTLADLNEDAKAKGIRIVNCSPISAVTAFEKQPLESFL